VSIHPQLAAVPVLVAVFEGFLLLVLILWLGGCSRLLSRIELPSMLPTTLYDQPIVNGHAHSMIHNERVPRAKSPKYTTNSAATDNFNVEPAAMAQPNTSRSLSPTKKTALDGTARGLMTRVFPRRTKSSDGAINMVKPTGTKPRRLLSGLRGGRRPEKQKKPTESILDAVVRPVGKVIPSPPPPPPPAGAGMSRSAPNTPLMGEGKGLRRTPRATTPGAVNEASSSLLGGSMHRGTAPMRSLSGDSSHDGKMRGRARASTPGAVSENVAVEPSLGASRHEPTTLRAPGAVSESSKAEEGLGLSLHKGTTPMRSLSGDSQHSKMRRAPATTPGAVSESVVAEPQSTSPFRSISGDSQHSKIRRAPATTPGAVSESASGEEPNLGASIHRGTTPTRSLSGDSTHGGKIRGRARATTPGAVSESSSAEEPSMDATPRSCLLGNSQDKKIKRTPATTPGAVSKGTTAEPLGALPARSMSGDSQHGKVRRAPATTPGAVSEGTGAEEPNLGASLHRLPGDSTHDGKVRGLARATAPGAVIVSSSTEEPGLGASMKRGTTPIRSLSGDFQHGKIRRAPGAISESASGEEPNLGASVLRGTKPIRSLSGDSTHGGKIRGHERVTTPGAVSESSSAEDPVSRAYPLGTIPTRSSSGDSQQRKKRQAPATTPGVVSEGTAQEPRKALPVRSVSGDSQHGRIRRAPATTPGAVSESGVIEPSLIRTVSGDSADGKNRERARATAPGAVSQKEPSLAGSLHGPTALNRSTSGGSTDGKPRGRTRATAPGAVSENTGGEPSAIHGKTALSRLTSGGYKLTAAPGTVRAGASRSASPTGRNPPLARSLSPSRNVRSPDNEEGDAPQSIRRRQIQEIMRDTRLTQPEKQKKIQELMAGGMPKPVSFPSSTTPETSDSSVGANSPERSNSPTSGTGEAPEAQEDPQTIRRKQIQEVMRDTGSAQPEKQTKVQQMMAEGMPKLTDTGTNPQAIASPAQPQSISAVSPSTSNSSQDGADEAAGIEDAQTIRRKQIQEIMRDAALSQPEKQTRIQELMAGGVPRPSPFGHNDAHDLLSLASSESGRSRSGSRSPNNSAHQRRGLRRTQTSETSPPPPTTELRCAAPGDMSPVRTRPRGGLRRTGTSQNTPRPTPCSDLGSDLLLPVSLSSAQSIQERLASQEELQSAPRSSAVNVLQRDASSEYLGGGNSDNETMDKSQSSYMSGSARVSRRECVRKSSPIPNGQLAKAPSPQGPSAAVSAFPDSSTSVKMHRVTTTPATPGAVSVVEPSDGSNHGIGVAPQGKFRRAGTAPATRPGAVSVVEPPVSEPAGGTIDGSVHRGPSSVGGAPQGKIRRIATSSQPSAVSVEPSVSEPRGGTIDGSVHRGQTGVGGAPQGKGRCTTSPPSRPGAVSVGPPASERSDGTESVETGVGGAPQGKLRRTTASSQPGTVSVVEPSVSEPGVGSESAETGVAGAPQGKLRRTTASSQPGAVCVTEPSPSEPGSGTGVGGAPSGKLRRATTAPASPGAVSVVVPSSGALEPGSGFGGAPEGKLRRTTAPPTAPGAVSMGPSVSEHGGETGIGGAPQGKIGRVPQSPTSPRPTFASRLEPNVELAGSRHLLDVSKEPSALVPSLSVRAMQASDNRGLSSTSSSKEAIGVPQPQGKLRRISHSPTTSPRPTVTSRHLEPNVELASSSNHLLVTSKEPRTLVPAVSVRSMQASDNKDSNEVIASIENDMLAKSSVRRSRPSGEVMPGAQAVSTPDAPKTETDSAAVSAIESDMLARSGIRRSRGTAPMAPGAQFVSAPGTSDLDDSFSESEDHSMSRRPNDRTMGRGLSSHNYLPVSSRRNASSVSQSDDVAEAAQSVERDLLSKRLNKRSRALAPGVVSISESSMASSRQSDSGRLLETIADGSELLESNGDFSGAVQTVENELQTKFNIRRSRGLRPAAPGARPVGNDEIDEVESALRRKDPRRSALEEDDSLMDEDEGHSIGATSSIHFPGTRVNRMEAKLLQMEHEQQLRDQKLEELGATPSIQTPVPQVNRMEAKLLQMEQEQQARDHKLEEIEQNNLRRIRPQPTKVTPSPHPDAAVTVDDDSESVENLFLNPDPDAVRRAEEDGLAIAIAVDEDDEPDVYEVELKMYDPDAKPPLYKHRRFRCYAALICCLAVAAILTAVTVAAKSGGGKTILITQAPSAAPSQAPTTTRDVAVRGELARRIGDMVNEPGTVYEKALNWILYDDPMELDEFSENLIQRYTLVLFYYQTSQEGQWTSCNPPEEGENYTCEFYEHTRAPDNSIYYFPREKLETRWLSERHECEWAEIQCHPETDGKVIAIDIRTYLGFLFSPSARNDLTDSNLSLFAPKILVGQNLTGTMPEELRHLDRLMWYVSTCGS
jgi:hypothetical protein